MDWQFVVLSGPSCVGKGPLCEALSTFYPELSAKLRHLVLYNSRPPRPGEVDGVDYFFRPRAAIEGLRGKERYLVVEARADLHALDWNQIRRMTSEGAVPFFEGNPFVAGQLLDSEVLKKLKRLAVFLSPLSKEEVEFLKPPERRVPLPDFVTNVMERKLLRRTERQKGRLALSDLEDIRIRAQSAFREMQEAWRFDHVLANHDGEDSEDWNAFHYPIGDARKTLTAFAALLEGGHSPLAEHWPKDLLR